MKTTDKQTTVTPLRRALTIAVIAAVTIGATQFASAANLVARWSLNESGSPYADSGPNGIQLVQDASTTTAISGSGIVGNAAQLNWQNPGPATRLVANGAALQTDSFGFSMWIQPVYLDQFNELMGKEMPYTNAANYLRMSWQLQVSGKNPTNDSAPLELVVRGSDRTVGDWFGNVVSSTEVPLFASSTNWIHIVGGYDAVSGALNLFVDGAGNFNGGTPGADNSNGNPLSIGTGKNGPDYVAFGGGALADEVQIYDAPLTADEVAYLHANPSKTLADRPAPNLAAHWKMEEPAEPHTNSVTGLADLFLDLNTTPGRFTTNGISGSAGGFDWAPSPGTGTRLFTTNAALQTDSFGFSMWVRPQGMGDYDNFLLKEIPYAPEYGGDNWEKLSWQVHLLGFDGSNDTNTAPVEFIVRGSERTNGDFFGVVTSGNRLPRADGTNWYFIAGGYDAQSGSVMLYVNGGADSSAGRPGAVNSQSNPLSFGTAMNGDFEYIAFGPGCYLDDVQMYDGPLTASQAALLMANPGKTLAQLLPFSIQRFVYNPADGDMTLVYDSSASQSYTIQATTNLIGSWTTVSNLTATGTLTTNVLSKTALDAVLGGSTRNHLFIRVSKP